MKTYYVTNDGYSGYLKGEKTAEQIIKHLKNVKKTGLDGRSTVSTETRKRIVLKGACSVIDENGLAEYMYNFNS